MKANGTAECPRLCVFRSNGHIYAQAIDDVTSTTVASSSDQVITIGKKTEKTETTKVAAARAVGFDVAKKVLATGVTRIVFDRGGYLYTGRVKAVAEGAREGGLEF